MADAGSFPPDGESAHNEHEAGLPLHKGSEESHHYELLKLVREDLQKSGFSDLGVDEKTLERFLVTNSLDPKKASDALMNHLKWWNAFAPLGYIPEDYIIRERRTGKLCLQGHDKKGRTLGVFLIVKHNVFERDIEEFKRYAVYSLEKAISSSKNEAKEVSVIVDLAGWGYKSVDIQGYLALLEILQEHYLKHLGKMILIHAPLVFWAVWKITSPFFNEFTRQKMIFVEDKNIKSVLLSEIDLDQMPDMYGGRMQLCPA
ncbi:hypothetical protein KP509_05G073700 [Ceratopteris richardii]|uniref:CRAL-TRIO domain-containing protein n=1 Tax=Ceratopteris richardii TaxID=49495 RepID=A0A8T2US60_CERRI|nr:hypothetical protein KP509_05G073700 [Ceratopteris richardii]